MFKPIMTTALALAMLAGCKARPESETPLGMVAGYYQGSVRASDGDRPPDPVRQKFDVCVDDDPMGIPRLVIEGALTRGAGCEMTSFNRTGNLVRAACRARDGSTITYEGVISDRQIVGVMHVRLSDIERADEDSSRHAADPSRAGAALAQLIPIGLNFTRTGECTGGATTRNPWRK